MQDQVGMTLQQALERSVDRFILQMETRPVVAGEEPAEQAQGGGPRTDIAQNDAQDRFLAARQLIGIAVQMVELAQHQPGARMKQRPGLRQTHPVAAAVEQGQLEHMLEAGDGCEH
jgi:hypothetical protein